MSGYVLPAEVEEQELLQSWQRHEQDGLDLLYRRYAAPLTAFCHHRLGNRSEAEDAAHETILKAYRALPRFRSGARLWPWLATIAANVCTDMQRSRERWLAQVELAQGEPASAASIDDDVARRARARIVGAAVNELPERFRTPLVLREFMGWSYEEIAAFSNNTVGSVRTTLMRSRRALQSRIEDVARRQGQWPLPVALAGRWRRMRLTMRDWRRAGARWGNQFVGSVWQSEGLASLMSGSAQAALTALAVVTTLAGMPGGAAVTRPARVPALVLERALSLPAAASRTGTASRTPAAHGPAGPARPAAQAGSLPPGPPHGSPPVHSTTAVTVPGVPVSAGSTTNRSHDGFEQWDTKPSVSVAGQDIAPVGGGVTWPDCTSSNTGRALCLIADNLPG